MGELGNILVTGFPYVRERYFAMWKHVPEPDRYRFLLPKRWTAKKGAVTFTPPEDGRISTTVAWFHDSDAPLIGGLLKGWMPAFPFRLWRMRRDVRLVYACSEPTLLSTLYFAVFAKLFGKKLALFTWENILYERKLRGLSRHVHELLLKMNLWLADGLVCGNPEGELIHRQYAKIPMVVIPMNGLDPDVFVRTDEKMYRGEDLSGQIVFSYIGAIGYRKGIHVAVRAMESVIERVPNARLMVAGSGEYEKQLREEIKESPVRDAITLLPWLDGSGVRELLDASDVFLYPSIPHKGWAEQFGYSMAEASLMELPVISTRSGSIPHVVKDGETGILVEPDNEQELADAMVRFGCDAELRQRLGTNGRDYVIRNFSHEVVAGKFDSFFAQFMR